MTATTTLQVADLAVREDIDKAVLRTATLARISISEWSGRAADANAAEIVKRDQGAKGTPGRYTKQLMSGADTELKALSGRLRRLRQQYLEMTLPWGDRAERLIPNAKLFDFVTAMQQAKNECTILLEEFLSVYPERKQQAMANLGGLANEALYPTESELRSRYEIRFSFEPLPDRDTYRMSSNMPEGFVEFCAGALDQRIRDAAQGAQLSILERIAEKSMALAKLLQKKLDGERTRIEDSTVTSLTTLADLLPSFDLFGDPRVQEASQDLTSLCRGLTPDEVRKQARIQQDTLAGLTSILAKLKDWGVDIDKVSPTPDP